MKNNNYIYARTCVYQITYNIVWCVKYRKKVLTPEIALELKSIMADIGKEKGFAVAQCEVKDEDHVCCLVLAPPKKSPTDIVKYLKGISGRTLLLNHPEITKQLNNGSLWNGSYFLETVGSANTEEYERYVERQKSVQR